MYKSSLQFLIKEILDTNCDRIVDIELKTMSFVKVCVLHIIVMSQLVTRSKVGRHKADDITPLIFYVRNI
jgi:hypothetical protein